MTKDETLKMAIESFDKIDMSNQSNEECARGWFIEGYVQALEQSAQEPVAWMNDIAFSMDKELLGTRSRIVPLYTHPTPSWQGLSDDELDKIIEKHKLMWVTVDFARAIEQALKEKNNAL